MEFQSKNIALQRGSTTTAINNYSSGGSGLVSAPLNYLQLTQQTSNLITNGIIQLPTSIGGLLGSVTGETANYFINSNGWIFSNGTKNIASISNDGELTVKTASITNGTTRADLSINSNAELLIGGANVLVDGYIDVTELKLNNGTQKIDLSVSNDGALLLNCDLYVLGNIYSDKEVSAFGLGTGSGGSGGLINIVNSYANLGGVFSDTDLTNTFNSYTINQINNRLINVENGALTQISSALVTNALGYVPYNSSNPSGYITASSLNGYLPLAGGSMNNTNMVNGLNAQYLNNQPIANFHYNSDNYYSSRDANTIIGGYGLNTTGNGTGNSNFPYQYGSVMTYDLGYGRTQLNFRHDGELTIRSKWGDSWNTNRIVWDSVNFNPANYLPLTGGFLSGFLDSTDRIVTNNLFLTRNSAIGNQILLNATGANYGAIQTVNSNSWGLGTGGGGVDRNINNTALIWDINKNVTIGGNIKIGISLSDSPTSTPACFDSGRNYSNGKTKDKLKLKLYDEYGFTVGSDGDVQYHSNIQHQTYIDNNLKSTINSTGLHINGEIKTNGNSVIHSGNIGSQSVSYATNAGGSSTTYQILLQSLGTATMSQHFPSGVYRNENGLGGNQSYSPVLHLNGSDTGWQIQADYGTGSNALRFRGEYNGNFSSWRNVWHDGNFTPSAYLPLSHPTVFNGSWMANGGSYGFSYYGGWSMSGGSEFSLIYKDGKGSLLTDGSHYAMEGSGFYSGLGDDFGVMIGFASDGTNCAFNAPVSASYFKGNGSQLTQITKMWAESHPTSYYLKNNWDGQYWQLTSNHPSAVSVGHSDYSNEANNANSAGSARYLTGAAHTNGSDGWWRSDGSCGWYNESYGVGIYATEAGNVRTYNGANFISSGNIYAVGEITAYSSSDERLKQNIQPLNKSLELINKLNPVQYNWNDKAKELNPNKTDKTDVGVIAQELEKVLPNLVHNIYNDEFLAVDYVKLIPYLIGAVQELTQEINTLKNNK